MLGNLPRERVIALLKASDIYIHSSLPGGGLSTSLLEAMYCKCAVIATPNEGANEVVSNRQNGILIKDYSQISNQLSLFINDRSQLITIAKFGKEHIKNNFNWHQSISKYEKIFKK